MVILVAGSWIWKDPGHWARSLGLTFVSYPEKEERAAAPLGLMNPEMCLSPSLLSTSPPKPEAPTLGSRSVPVGKGYKVLSWLSHWTQGCGIICGFTSK